MKCKDRPPVTDPDAALDHEPEIECTCTPAGGCGDPGEAGCCFCEHLDPYLPCPVIGFGCGWDGGELCECCTPEEFRAARVAYSPLRVV